MKNWLTPTFSTKSSASRAGNCYKVVVCVLDAGPLIHLDQLGTAGLLSEMGTVFCPTVVLSEAEKHRPGITARVEFIHVVEPSRSQPARLKTVAGLHAGELAALAWAEEFGADIFLSDDSLAREAAGEMKIKVCGTVGVILQAVKNGALPAAEARTLLRRIPADSTLHLKQALLDSAIASLR